MHHATVFLDPFADQLPAARMIASSPNPEETMANEPRDQRPKIRLSQLSHGAG